MTSKSEWIERRGLEAMHEVCPNLTRAGLGLALHDVDGAVVSVCVRSTSILLNRVIGLGLNAPATDMSLSRIKKIYTNAGVERYFVHVCPEAEPQDKIRGLLDEAGFENYRGWMKFTRDTSPADPVPSNLTVRKVDSTHGSDFARICGNAFDMEKDTWPLLEALMDHPNWHIYMSFDGSNPAGTGGLYVEDGIAKCDFGATDPQFRQRGSQSAVLAARINAAREMGAELLVTETGEAVPDDPQHSYSNILKRGFEESYLRENWVLSM